MRALWGQKLTDVYDLAIVGSGFAGSVLAMAARRLGHTVVLIERGTHPRTVIGESSTPLSNLLLEELATRYDLPALQSLTKWGSWQRDYPEIAVGLKRGFTFHHHTMGDAAAENRDRQSQLLVAASPRDEIADTHWYRADFDHFLVQEARRLGVDYADRVLLKRFADCGNQVRLEGERESREVTFGARFVVDATGPRGFLHRALQLGEHAIEDYPATQALYSHFSGVSRLEDGSFSRTRGETPPYPIDAAAVHHVFEGGWVWVLQFNNGITSAGVAATDRCASRLRLAEGEAGWRRLLDSIPALQEQFAEAKATMPFTHMPRVSFRSAQVCGNRWALLPSAAGFVDPLLSTGFPGTLLGVTRLAEIFEKDWNCERMGEALRRYAAQTEAELMATAGLIGALYANMNNFPVFVALSLLYFAAASYSEAVRRLGRPEKARSFLLCEDDEFGPASRALFAQARQAGGQVESAALIRRIHAVIEPFNVAGLERAERENWYPVDPEDLYKSAKKLGVRNEDIDAMLTRCGLLTH